MLFLYSSIQGPPVTEQSLVTTLFVHGVTVGIGHQGVNEEAYLSAWAARNLRWDAAWVSYSVCDAVHYHDVISFPVQAHIDSRGLISMEDALNMATTNVEKLLGVTRRASDSDTVATVGGELLSFEGKVVAVTSRRRGVVDHFE